MCIMPLYQEGELLVQFCFHNPRFPNMHIFLFPRMTPLFLSAPFFSISFFFTEISTDFLPSTLKNKQKKKEVEVCNS